MKQILSIFLLCSLLLPSLGTWVWFKQQQKRIRKEVKHQFISEIDEEALTLLVFTEDELTEKLRWEHAKEFEYQGKMYDVVKQQIKDNTHYFWCWEDAKETQLNQKLEQLIAKTFGKKDPLQPQKQQLFQFYKSLFFFHSASWTIPSFSNQNSTPIFGYHLEYQSISKEINTPPPIFI